MHICKLNSCATSNWLHNSIAINNVQIIKKYNQVNHNQVSSFNARLYGIKPFLKVKQCFLSIVTQKSKKILFKKKCWKKISQNFPSVTSFKVPLNKNKLLVTVHKQIQTLLYQSKSTTQDNNQRITISHNRRVQ